MKVLLVRPPAIFFRGAIPPSISLPVGILSIAATLEAAGIEVHVYDAQLSPTRPVSPCGEGVLMGDSWDEIAEKISAYNADVVGISCLFSTQLQSALKTADLVKRVCPDAVTVAGGAHPTVRPGDFLSENSSVDIVCLGEGESTMLEVVRRAVTHTGPCEVPGTAVWKDGRIHLNEMRPRIDNLDELPFPAYHLVDLEDYFYLFQKGYVDRPGVLQEGGHRAVSLLTSRGCPFNCVFCSIHLHMGKKWRGNSSDYVGEHLKLLAERYGVRHFHFEDDNISFNRERFVRIIHSLGELDVTWDTPNGVRVDTLTASVVEQCRKSGCTYLVFGVESGCQRVLDKVVDKRLNLSAVLDAALWCQKSKLNAMAFFVIGFPGESKEEMRQTVDFAIMLLKKYDVNPHVFVATPLPGTVLEKIFLENNLIETPLATSDLAAMTQGNFSVNGLDFDSADVDLILKGFFREYKMAVVVGAVKYMFFKPRLIVKMVKVFCSCDSFGSMKRKFLSFFVLKKSY